MTFDAFVDWQTYRLRHGFDKPVQRPYVAPAPAPAAPVVRVRYVAPLCGVCHQHPAEIGIIRCSACKRAHRERNQAYRAPIRKFFRTYAETLARG